MNNIPVNIVIRGVEALESIANSLSTLAEDTKARKELNVEIYNRLENLEEVLLDLKDDPFGLNKRN
ncbi:hypothetical protein P7D85_06625 [Enterococcus hulanensis]|uniref:DUF1657 domain-containing protein n=1 Tax=Enterococcus hulanensis TaxID=2559929 RepID=A0ABU3EX49_9ENTE|nr:MULTISPECIES: hypothetical protein [Enterococcus]MDT2531877.1 hypothetical protein [Enterococcus raffinosus]MDT2599443.1 hypothetical protein [Enterococcus hulanensis]MDT2608850.1 hypothetical protein [Enterococcus hulanensis]MDT2616605.1 hypothetical protein [Enterococcus hulanensis]MDT2627355.1 hypothetical protein [Enterococcus hulanensis]